MWAIFVDDLHLDFRNTGRLRDLLGKVTTALIQEGDVYGMSSSGPSNLALPLTTDRSAIPAAIRRTTGNGLKMEDVLERAATEQRLSEVRYRAGVSFDAAQRSLTELAAYVDADGRTLVKAFIFASNGHYLASTNRTIRGPF